MRFRGRNLQVGILCPLALHSTVRSGTLTTAHHQPVEERWRPAGPAGASTGLASHLTACCSGSRSCLCSEDPSLLGTLSACLGIAGDLPAQCFSALQALLLFTCLFRQLLYGLLANLETLPHILVFCLPSTKL